MSFDPIVYVNGTYSRASEAGLSVFDQGFLLGDGVFDVVSAWKGRIFKMDEHIERFFRSLQAARLNVSLTKDDWRDIILEVCRRNDLQDASIRFIVTRGVPKEVLADPRDFIPTIVVWAVPYIFLADEETRKNGIRLYITHLRGMSPDTLDPAFKSLDRLHFQLARLDALEAGYDDVIWLSRAGYVLEGPASNLFLVKNGALITPGEEILPGITRATFIELAEREGVPVRQLNFTPFDLYNADEVFTTSTAGGALAVREIMGRKISQAPGPVTTRLQDAYFRMREAGEYSTDI
ncbi:MAG: aminotransferase class IV [Alphaproteobacteria bacterium]